MVATVARTDVSYCDPNICPPGLSHVACGQDIVCVRVIASISKKKKIRKFTSNEIQSKIKANTGTFQIYKVFNWCGFVEFVQAWNARCPDDAEFVEFSPELQQITLDAHNKLRNQLAMGETPRYPPAARMATMVYLYFL